MPDVGLVCPYCAYHENSNYGTRTMCNNCGTHFPYPMTQAAFNSTGATNFPFTNTAKKAAAIQKAPLYSTYGRP